MPTDSPIHRPLGILDSIGPKHALVVELYPKIELVAVALKAKGKLTEDEVVSICGMGERRDPVFEPEPTDA
jgi:hypothetical protein